MKIITIIIFIILSSNLYGQYNNTISLTFLPQDNGIGLRYDRYFDNFGIYYSGSYGNYSGYDIDKQYYEIRDHIKIASGITINADQAYLLAGITYHNYGLMILTDNINKKAFKPFSFEMGISVHMGRIMAGFRMDIFKWEGCYEIGINF